MPTQITGVVALTTSSTLATGSAGARKQHFGVFAVLTTSATADITAVTMSGTVPASFGSRVLTPVRGTGLSILMVLLWGFGDDGGTVSFTVTNPGAASRYFSGLFDSPAEVSDSSITSVQVSASGTGTTADPTAVSAPEGSLVVALACWANATTTNTATDTPGGAQGLTAVNPAATTNLCTIGAYRLSATAGAHKRVWSGLAASYNWAAMAIAITPTAATTVSTTGLYKGRGTKALDAQAGS